MSYLPPAGKEFAYPEPLDMCVQHSDGTISHANDAFTGPGLHNVVDVLNDRPTCERLSDGSIAHVCSKPQ